MALLGVVRMPVVYGGDAALDVVQDLRHHEARDAEAGETGCAGPTKIMRNEIDGRRFLAPPTSRVQQEMPHWAMLRRSSEGSNQLPKLIKGVKFRDGIELTETNQNAAA